MMWQQLWRLWVILLMLASVNGQINNNSSRITERPRWRNRNNTRPLIRPRQLASGTGNTELQYDRHQTDTVILLLQRLSDRLAVLETMQSQRGERMDTIHYRLTRLELQAEEQKSLLSELSNNIRHRMETSDTDRDRISDKLDEINTALTNVAQQNRELKTEVTTISSKEVGSQNNEGPKLQAAMTSIHSLRALTQGLKKEVSNIAEDMTSLSNITKTMDDLSQNMVTKEYLHQNINEIKAQQLSTTPMLQMMEMMQQPRGKKAQSKEPEDCWQLLKKGKTTSGVYLIKPKYAVTPFFVYCDMETDGGGWTVIQRREDGSVDFLREWADYKYGFGNLAGEFWLGNENIHLLTNQHVSKLRIDLADFDQQEARASYSAFAMGSELEGYSLKLLGKYSGDAGDSLRYHVGRRFSTIDVDNDAWPGDSCARDHHGAWWYKACETSNLNARYLHGPVPGDHEYSGIYWYDFRGPLYSLWRSRMMIRRGGNIGQPIFKDFQEVKNEATTLRTNTTRQNRTNPTRQSGPSTEIPERGREYLIPAVPPEPPSENDYSYDSYNYYG